MNKKLLLGIAVLAIGIVVLPQTIAMFSGQHNFYDTLTIGGSGVPCEKCHADILAELQQPGQVNLAHATISGTGTVRDGCESCHGTVAAGKEGLTQGPTGTFHAAIAPACLDCHGGGLTSGPGLNAMQIVNGTDEVHKKFVNVSEQQLFLKGANEACIACHTHIMVNITWQRAVALEFNSTMGINTTDGSHVWNIGAYNATGTNITTTSSSGPASNI